MNSLLTAISRRVRAATLWKIASTLGVPAAVLAALWIVVRESPEILRSVRLNVPLVLLSFLVECSGLLLTIPVWRRILAAYSICATPRDDVRIYCYSAIGFILPGGIWSILGRSTLYQRLGANPGRVAAAGVVETLITGVAAAGVYGLVALIRPTMDLWRRPELGFGIAAVALVLVYPPVFNTLTVWVLRRASPRPDLLQANFGLKELLAWLGLEMLVVVIGGIALYVLMSSLISTPFTAVLSMIAAWAAAVAASNLLFWLPGTPLLRDGAVVVALTPILSLPSAIVFLGVLRFWTIMSLLVVAGLTWVILDSPIHGLKTT